MGAVKRPREGAPPETDNGGKKRPARDISPEARRRSPPNVGPLPPDVRLGEQEAHAHPSQEAGVNTEGPEGGAGEEAEPGYQLLEIQGLA